MQHNCMRIAPERQSRQSSLMRGVGKLMIHSHLPNEYQITVIM